MCIAASLGCGAALGQQAVESGTSNPVAENAGEPTAEALADQFRAKLASLDHLEVVSNQRVSFVRRELYGEDGDRAIEKNAVAAITDTDSMKAVRVKVCSFMTENSFHARMWKAGLAQPATELHLVVVDGVPMMTERQWYPSWNKYREETYPSARPEGINSLAMQSCLFDELPSRVCATAEFFQTWLGVSYQADLFQRIIAQSTLVEQGTFDNNPAICLKRQVYETETSDTYRSRKDTFWMSPDTHLLLGWQIELVDISFDKYAAYQVEENKYDYRSCEISPEEQAGEGGVSPAARSNSH